MSKEPAKPRTKTATATPAMKNRGGRPGFEPQDPDAAVAIVDTMGGSSTVTDICLELGISNITFYRWLRESDPFSAAVMRLRARVDDRVERAFLDRCIGYTEKVFEEKLDKDGNSVDLRKEIHVPSDPGAAMNWLKNRRPEEWRDRKEIILTSDHAALVEKYLNGDQDD